MSNSETIKSLTERVEKASTDFEKTNNDLKRRYIIWNIEVFNKLGSLVSVGKGTFGTGYPFYALDKNLHGKLPIIEEQIRYNRQLVRDGEPVQKSIWQCKRCLEQNYSDMPDLKKICKPCPNTIDELKPRKIINRLPDIDMWLICEDGHIEQAQEELARLLEEYKMHTSDVAPLESINNVCEISKRLKEGVFPKVFLPIDSHIIEYSKIKELIEDVPEILHNAKKEELKPYLPIWPKFYRKVWQYDDEAYNFIYDYLSAFTEFNFTEELQESLNTSRKKVINEHTPKELFDFLMKSATKANFRRFQSLELEKIFLDRINGWKVTKDIKEIDGDRKQKITEIIDIDDEYSK